MGYSTDVGRIDQRVTGSGPCVCLRPSRWSGLASKAVGEPISGMVRYLGVSGASLSGLLPTRVPGTLLMPGSSMGGRLSGLLPYGSA